VNSSPDLQNELAQRHRTALLVVLGFLVLTLILAAIAFWAVRSVTHPGDPGLVMTLWIAILIFGLGALVLRRTRFAATRLKDIAAVRGASALLKTLQSTTIQIACLGGAIALMGFVITLRTGDWLDMLRAAGVAVIVLIYGYPIKRAWQSAVVMLGSDAG
jgi:hypothetical protein